MEISERCLTKQRVQNFLEGQLSLQEETQTIAHLDDCLSCREALEDSVGGSPWIAKLKDLLSGGENGSTADTSPVVNTPGECDAELESQRALVADRLSFLAPSDDPRMLGRMGVYEILGVVGYGAMGVVLKAFEASLNRHVALKVLWPHLAVLGAARQRFARESRAAAAVVHEHVVPIYAVDEFRGLPYIVLRYVPGRSLQERIARQGRLQLEEVLRIGRQIALALDAAHSQGLVHRDVKPANILLENGIERVLVTDFGLARAADDASLTHSGMVAGTPQFMAPEQARGDAIDHRSDLFSLGSVMYTMCAGHAPFRAETMVGVLNRICNTEPRDLREVNPEVPEWLARFIQRLMTKSVERRFQTAAEVARILEDELAYRQCPTSIARPRRQWLKRNWTRWFAVAVVTVSALSLAVGGRLAWQQLRPATEPVRLSNRHELPVGSGNAVGSGNDVWAGPATRLELSDLALQVERLQRELVTPSYGGPRREFEWPSIQAQAEALEQRLERNKQQGW